MKRNGIEARKITTQALFVQGRKYYDDLHIYPQDNDLMIDVRERGEEEDGTPKYSSHFIVLQADQVSDLHAYLGHWLAAKAEVEPSE